MAENLRPGTNKQIAIEDVGITVNGKVTNVTNKRNDSTVDGFAYTASTIKNDNGNYEYNYEKSYGEETVFSKENPITRLPFADGVGNGDMFRNIEEFRSNSDETGKNEVIIDSVVSGNMANGYKGQATKGSNFRYNEGNRGNIASSPVNGENDFEYAGATGDGSKEGDVSFFQQQLTTARFGDQVEKIRSLKSL